MGDNEIKSNGPYATCNKAAGQYDRFLYTRLWQDDLPPDQVNDNLCIITYSIGGVKYQNIYQRYKPLGVLCDHPPDVDLST